MEGYCPECGKHLEIPDELEEFSCLYCGSRLHRRELRQRPGNQDGKTAYETLERELLLAVTQEKNPIRYLNRTDYPPLFERYVENFQNLFYLLCPAAQYGSMDALAGTLLDQIAAAAEGQNRHFLEDVRYTICLLTVPAIRRMGEAAGEAFCKSLEAQWRQRYPKTPFRCSTYAELSQGFSRKGLCFITTAVCTQAGKGDSCPELQAFRKFRDEWLQNQPDGPELIAQYYNIAPAIVLAVDLLDHPETVYPALWDRYLSPCYGEILAGNPMECKMRYVQMVRELEEKYRIC